MSLTPAAIRALAEKGLSASDIADIAEANAPTQSSGAVRQKRYRDNKRNERDVTRNVTPPLNDIYSNPPGNPDETNVSSPPFAEKVVSDWNAGPGASGARKANKLDASRLALLKARVRDHGEDGVLTAIRNLGRSRFHCGENDRGWRADLGWVLKAGNCLKAIEMAEPESAERVVAHVTDHAAYLAKLAEKPWARRDDPQPVGTRRNGNTGPPRSIGQLAAGIAGNA